MNETADASSLPNTAFLAAFRRRKGTSAALRFDDFMDLALYGHEVGYYRSARKRVGRNRQTDFYTSTSSGPVFAELVVAATHHLLRTHGANPSDYIFVEIGAEPGAGLLDNIAHPYASHRSLHLGDQLDLCGPCIVFSNELFDAQPCRRFIRGEAEWIELGVKEHDGGLLEIELGASKETWLPDNAPKGYRLDAPRAAVDLCARLAGQPWHGLFLALDYGKSWAELRYEVPGGTLRAYRRHAQSNEILAFPGDQDLTCHICWDWLSEALSNAGFSTVEACTQEAFFVRNATTALASMTKEEAGRFSTRKQSLMQLLHPAHMGVKFQALHAWKGAR